MPVADYGSAIVKLLGEIAGALKEYIKSGNARYYRRTIKKLRNKNQIAEDYMDADEDILNAVSAKIVLRLKRKKEKLRRKFRASKI